MFLRDSIKYRIIWPVMLMVTLLILGMAFFIYNQSAESLHTQGLAMTEAVRQSMENALIARETAEEVMEREMFGQAVMMSLLMEKGINYSELAELSKRSGIDEFWITDEEGKTLLTNLDPDVEFDFGADPGGQAYEFMTLITGEEAVVTQPAQERTLDGKMYKFIGVGGWAGPRIIQVAREGQMLTELDEQVGAKPLIGRLREELGQQVLFSAVISPEGEILVASDDTFQELPSDLIGCFEDSMDKKGTAHLAGSFGGKKATYYTTFLTNGQGLMLALSNEILENIRNFILAAAICALVVIAFVLVFVVDRQMKRLDQLKSALQEIGQGEGDLTRRIQVSAQDEIGTLAVHANGMLEVLQSTIRGISSAVDQFYSASQELSSTADEVHRSNHEVSREIQKVSQEVQDSDQQLALVTSGVEEMAEDVDRIVSNANETVESTSKTQDLVNEGRETLGVLTQNLQVIRESTQANNLVIEHLAANSEQIEHIIGMISQIADQTNLLALNAAIEAARAGDAGRGFAVVAEEVRELAEDSMESAKEVSDITNSIKEGIQDIVQTSDKYNHDLEVGLQAFEKVDQVFRDVSKAGEEMLLSIEEISSSNQHFADQWQDLLPQVHEVQRASRSAVESTENIVHGAKIQTETMDEIAASTSVLAKAVEELKQTLAGYRV
ncbi:MAG: methyl-accepting chemotaxis protein [Clostridia bacterium]|nr:methyl-accepting chemotaxis protein [Clostridia bacterium]